MVDASGSTAGGVGRTRPIGRDSAPVIRDQLRAEILRGDLVPGTVLSQAQVALEFGISRGPVREAFRMLERDGLLDSRINHRARITSLSVGDLESLYALRVLNESLALAVSVPSFTADELDELDELAAWLREPDADGFDFDRWDDVHQRFHMLLLAHSGSRMLALAAEWGAHTQRYRRAYAEGGRGLPRGAAEHAEMARLVRWGDARHASRLLALHLSRAALTLLAQMAPAHEPRLLRSAIRQAVGDDESETSDRDGG